MVLCFQELKPLTIYNRLDAGLKASSTRERLFQCFPKPE